MTAGKQGRIITFYSYKGGTGRSMALANVAWVLASHGKRVLILDWDLEAPGVHRYLYPFLVDQDLESSEGVIDFVIKFATAAATPEAEVLTSSVDASSSQLSVEQERQSEHTWYKPYANILRYAASLSWKFKPPGTLDFIPAGRQGATYSTRVNSFNWQAFYEKLGGGQLLELAKERMRAEYDYVLIDSRTGVSDTSGICTVQMPDVLAVCFTLNNQSIEGASAVAASVDSQRRSKSGEPEVRIFPIPMRVERFEKERLELAREAAKIKFRQFLWHLPGSQRDEYWGQVETFYEPFYAYEEVLATFGDRPRETNSMLASAERITSYLTNRNVQELDPPTEHDRQRVLVLYARQKSSTIAKGSEVVRDGGQAESTSRFDLYLSYNSADHAIVEDVARKLGDDGLDSFVDRWYLSPGAPWRSRLEQILGSCKAVAVFVGPGEMGRWQQREVDVALDRQAESPSFPVIPVLLPGCEPPLGFLRQLTWVDLRNQTVDRALVILAKAARGEAPGPELGAYLDSVRDSICPYRGLLHFREEDAPFFFGRETAIHRLVDGVQRQPLTAIVGASGCGKSSLVRAGLLPKLRRDHETSWETVILFPTDQPLKSLAAALLQLLEPLTSEIERLAEAAKLAEHFRSRTISLYDMVARILEKQPGTDRALIVVDQFEELYTLTSDEEVRRRFVDELLAVSSRVESKVNVVLTLRGDFVGRTLAYRPLSDQLQDAQINLGPMIREELESAICKPAEKILFQFEAGLVSRILDDVGDEPGNLPLLQFVLKELWDKRRRGVLLNEAYDSFGGLQGAVATKADEIFRRLSQSEQSILQRVFLRMVRPSEGGLDTRRRVAFSELPPGGAQLVAKLANERLLVTNQSASGLEQTVEVAHEALISNWSTLRAWVNEDREFLLWRDRLDPLVAEWKRAQESDEALLRGPLLIEAQKWFDQRSRDLSERERNFISASCALRERLAREEKERQEREIEAAEKLAEGQKRLQRLTLILGLIALVAVAALIVVLVSHCGLR